MWRQLPYDGEWFDATAFDLMYHAHGGSGLGLRLDEIEEMEIPRIRRWTEMLDERREAEADAIRDATAKKETR